MDFTYSAEQEMLRDSVTRVLAAHYDFETRQGLVRAGAGRSDRAWPRFRELGLMALPFSEPAGGLGGSIVDLVAVQELFGAALVIDPYWSSSIFAGSALASAPDHVRAAATLRGLIEDDRIVAFAHEEGQGTSDFSRIATRLLERDGGYVLEGAKQVVLGAAESDHMVVSARLSGRPGEREGLALLLVDRAQAGISLTPFQMIDGRRAAHVRFEGVVVDRDHLIHSGETAASVLSSVLATAIITLCAEAVGAMQSLLSQTAQYTHMRRQFGVPIASFQTVAHRLADMKIALAKARATLLHTTALAEAGQVSAIDLAVLKGQVGRLGRLVGEAAIQSHGGIGMTDALMIGHLHKRILVVDTLFGGHDHAYRVVGRRPAGSDRALSPAA